jgi:hypothetical protein
MPKNRFLQIFWMMHVGEMIPPNKAIRPSKGQKVHGVREHTETVSEKFCAR